MNTFTKIWTIVVKIFPKYIDFRGGFDFKYVIFKCVVETTFMTSSGVIAFRWMTRDPTDYKPTLDQISAGCCQAISNCRNLGLRTSLGHKNMIYTSQGHKTWYTFHKATKHDIHFLSEFKFWWVFYLSHCDTVAILCYTWPCFKATGLHLPLSYWSGFVFNPAEFWRDLNFTGHNLNCIILLRTFWTFPFETEACDEFWSKWNDRNLVKSQPMIRHPQDAITFIGTVQCYMVKMKRESTYSGTVLSIGILECLIWACGTSQESYSPHAFFICFICVFFLLFCCFFVVWDWSIITMSAAFRFHLRVPDLKTSCIALN